ncbi:hypothetical protein PtA15_7A828 [Puccinia triticina]|uniref:Kinase n=1 Tax=Puccinia triticina TaxID=208348 RepID=A0ABY7CRJ7_9BASI|nr:uncharacterized protein PtA15_7A828 [Puccinia triticina]WAQ87097.1 hypothetical protein PtA15_7A828 [Puccinia triticina]WAR56954.1 hypothetical protein PtB15_7B807 [Puccinia triticina]
MATISQVLQAGGHQDQVAIDSNQPSRIIKKTKKSELEFYRSLANQLERPPSQQNAWSDWRPQFFGSSNHQTDEQVSIVLENLTYKWSTAKTEQGEEQDQLFNHPNVIDIKLGQRLYDDQATPEKQERMHRAALETTSAKLGIRLTGAQVINQKEPIGCNLLISTLLPPRFDQKTNKQKIWNNLKGEYSSIPKSFGKSIKPDGSDLQINFNSLFPVSDSKPAHELELDRLTYSAEGLPSEILKQVIDRSIIPKIQKILDYLSSFNWRIYGASILIVFEADLSTLNTLLSSPDHNRIIQDIASVKVIDFAHVQLADSPDPGLLKGFQSTLDLFHQLSAELALI